MVENHIASGGLCGGRRIAKACFEDRSNSVQIVKWNCIVSFNFWCKEKGIEEMELVDLLGSLQVFSFLFTLLFFDGLQH